METNPSVEFDFFLSQKLSMTVAELHQMSSAEYVGWQVYYARKAQREEMATAKAKGR